MNYHILTGNKKVLQPAMLKGPQQQTCDDLQFCLKEHQQQTIVQILSFDDSNEKINKQICEKELLCQKREIRSCNSYKYLNNDEINLFQKPSETQPQILDFPQNIKFKAFNEINEILQDKQQRAQNLNNSIDRKDNQLNHFRTQQLDLESQHWKQRNKQLFLIEREFFLMLFQLINCNKQKQYLKMQVLNLQTTQTFKLSIDKQSFISRNLMQFQTPNELFQYLRQHSETIKCLQSGRITFNLQIGKIQRVKQINTTRHQIFAQTLLIMIIWLKKNYLSKDTINEVNTQNNALNQQVQALTKREETLNEKIQILQKQNQQIKKQIFLSRNHLQKLKPDVKQSGSIYNQKYVRSGLTKLQGSCRRYLRHCQGAQPDLCNYDSDPGTTWRWYEMEDGLYVLQSYSGKILCGTSWGSVDTRQHIKTWQKWKRIKYCECSIWQSHHKTILHISVNYYAELNLKTSNYNNMSYWVDTIDG